MSDNLTLSVENISGLYGTRRFEFKPGLNLANAPNAAGKSSLIHALQALLLEERDLMPRSHFLHSFESMGRVELTMGNRQYVRRLRAKADGLSVGGEAIHPEGRKVNLFCVASEDNELIDRIKTGKMLRSILLDFSDYRYYELLGDYFEQQRLKSESQLRQYRDKQADLQLLTSQLRTIEAELEQLENKRKTMEEVPLELIVKTEKERLRLKQAHKELSELIRDITETEGDISRSRGRLEELRNREQRSKQRVGDFESQHPAIEEELALMGQELESLKNQAHSLRSEMSTVQDKLHDTGQNWTRYVKYGKEECFACGSSINSEKLRNRQKQLEQTSSDLANEINSLEWQIKEREKESIQLENEWTEVRSKIRVELNNASRAIDVEEDNLKKLEAKLDECESHRPQLSGFVEQLEASFNKETREKLEMRRELDEKITRQDENRKTKMASIEQIGDVRIEIIQLEEENHFYQQLNQLVLEKAEEVKRALREMFNERIAEVYSLLEFDEDFERVYLDDGFQLKIIRRFGDQRKPDNINTLSRGEKETVALVLMLAGREAYLPDFPLFIADETTFYDSTRFRRVVEYISKRAPYTIITNLVPKDRQESLTIEYELAKL